MKIKALIVAAMMSLMSTAAYAGAAVGVSIAGVELDADGAETYGSAQKRSETLQVPVGSVFFELGGDFGGFDVSLGVDYIPYDIESAEVDNHQTVNANTNKAKVTIKDHFTYYGMVGLGDSPLFVKVAYSEADALTDETISNMQTDGSITRTNSTYPDTTLKGVHVSIGASIDAGPLALRAEVGSSDYDEMKVTSSSGGNTVTVNADGTFVKLSLVHEF